MSVFDRIDHYIADFRRMRKLAKTERMIRALPSEVQKDIGWPELMTKAGGVLPTNASRVRELVLQIP